MLKQYYNERLARKLTAFPGATYSFDPNLTLETLRLTHTQWDYEEIVDNKNFTIRWIIEFPDKPWNWESFHSMHWFVWYLVDLFPHKPWNWNEFRDPPFFLIQKYISKPWNWNEISRKANMEDLLQYPDFHWNWEVVTIHSDISTDDMIAHPDLPWDIDTLSFTKIDDDVLRFIEFFVERFNIVAWDDFSTMIPWSIYKKTTCQYFNPLRMEFLEPIEEEDFVTRILGQGYLSWNWEKLSRWVNVNVIVKYNMFPWIECEILKNKSLRYEHLKYFSTIRNSPKAPCETMESIVKQWHSACVIQRQWKICSTNPEYALCKKIVNDFISTFNCIILTRD